MANGKRKLILNWCPAHDDLKRSVEKRRTGDGCEVGNGRGWTYLTFFPRGTNAGDVLYDIERLRILARENHYYLPHEVIAQHNKVIVTAYSEYEPPVSPLLGLFERVAAFARLYDDARRYPVHGVYGKFGGIYQRPEKGRILVIYSRSADALLAVYESLEKLLSEIRVEGFRFELDLSNGLSAIPRLLDGFDDPGARRAGNRYHRIADPARFGMLLDQARKDYEMYRFKEAEASGIGC